MPVITKPASIEKNTAASISLDKSALAAVASVAADSYYSNSTNWKEVFIYYKSSVGNQREILRFDATAGSPVTSFLVSDKARDVFQVQKIVIIDFDNGSIAVPRSQLTVADFDVTLSGGSPASSVVWDFASRPAYSLNAQNEIVSSLTSLTTNTSDVLFSTNLYNVPSNGLEIKMVANYGFFTESEYFGFCDSSNSLFSGFLTNGPFRTGTNNGFTPAPYPSVVPEIEFKIVVSPSSVAFYTNGTLIATNIVSNSSIRLATRFNNDLNIKSCTIVEL